MRSKEEFRKIIAREKLIAKTGTVQPKPTEKKLVVEVNPVSYNDKKISSKSEK